MMLEILYFPLMFLSGLQVVECAQVLSFACFGVYFTGIDPVLSCFQFAYHSIIILVIKTLRPVDTGRIRKLFFQVLLTGVYM
jgi:hypothetical protein